MDYCTPITKKKYRHKLYYLRKASLGGGGLIMMRLNQVEILQFSFMRGIERKQIKKSTAPES